MKIGFSDKNSEESRRYSYYNSIVVMSRILARLER